MSAGAFIPGLYESNAGLIFPISIQPETLTLTLNTVVNVLATGTAGVGLPSAKVSGGRNSIGVNARLVRVRTSTATPPPGYLPGGIITLPVFTPTSFNQYGKGQTGTYTINGTEYAVTFVGKTPERVN